MSDMRFQISDSVIARNEAISFLQADCHARTSLAMTWKVGIRPALGIEAASFSEERRKDIVESPTRRGTPNKKDFN